MRQKRAKQTRKTLSFFQQTLGLGGPQAKSRGTSYHILLDGTFLVACVRFQLIDDIPRRMERLLHVSSSFYQSDQQEQSNGRRYGGDQHPPIHWYMTQSSLHELQEIVKIQKELSDSKRRQQDPAKAERIVQNFQAAYDWAVDHCQAILDVPKLLTSAKKSSKRKRKEDLLDSDNDQQQSKRKELSTPSQRDIFQWIQLCNLVHRHHNDPSHHNPLLSHSYLVASQDDHLLDHLRHIHLTTSDLSVCPIVRLANNSVLLLEQPNKSLQAAMDRSTNKSVFLSSKEQEIAQALATEQSPTSKAVHSTLVPERSLPQYQPRQLARHRKAKGPNPLSCKKKKTEPKPPKQNSPQPNPSDTDRPSKRIRRRKKANGGTDASN